MNEPQKELPKNMQIPAVILAIAFIALGAMRNHMPKGIFYLILLVLVVSGYAIANYTVKTWRR